MKKVSYTVLILIIGLYFSSCDKGGLLDTSPLDRTPLDQISDPEFWNSEEDVKLFVNGFYESLPTAWSAGGADPSPDLGTDMVMESVSWYGGSHTNRLDGTITVPTSGGGWNWGNIRNANYFLENADRAQSSGMLDHYIGEGHFFRAWFYFELLRDFGDLPIIKQAVNVNDENILYGSRSSRSEVVDFILDDLDQAISKMQTNAGPSRVNKDVAALFKARVALYEGTWEKYHQGTEFAGDTDGTGYLNAAANAAKSVIDAGNYSLSEGDPEDAYYDLFVQTDYSNNPEVLLYKHYDAYDQNLGNNLWNVPNGQGMTQEFTKHYLCEDGEPIAESSNCGDDKTLSELENNRDPRLDQSVLTPGELDVITVDGDSVFFDVPNLNDNSTGITLMKWRANWIDPNNQGRRTPNIGFIYFRYAEALLIYAEAKAELGELTQADVDMTINKLRDRVGMPHMTLGSITTDPNWPEYGYSMPDYLYEIRRERAVELFGEGFRLDDLMRWRAHNLFVGKRFTGTTYTESMKEEYPDMNANNEGFLDPYIDYLNGGTYGFNPDRDYLLPLPTNELTLNENLEQNPGW